MFDERYDRDPVAAMRPRRGPVQRRQVELQPGLELEHSASEFFGEVVGVADGLLTLRDFDGATRSFPLRDGFLVDGQPVEFVAARRPSAPQRTASGSVAAPDQRARIAKASRIFVEGVHDAELVEQVWGADLRHEAVVVELLEGADHLHTVLDHFGPGPGQRAGVLLDHLVPGSKESRIADSVADRADAAHIRVVGHPFVDIWQSVRPDRLGMREWPEIPRSLEWKIGVCRHLGWPAEEPADIADAWKRIRSRVRNYTDLEPALIGRVEELIDFVTG